MAFDPTTLCQTHALTTLQIQSNTQISSRATAVISNLSNPGNTPTTTDTTNETAPTATNNPPLLILRAQARWSSKLISIVEIAKRDLLARGVVVWQYTALGEEMGEVERKAKPTGPATATTVGAGDGQDDDGDDSEDEDGAFQTMGAHKDVNSDLEMGKKKRATPVLTVYLATGPVKGLKGLYG